MASDNFRPELPSGLLKELNQIKSHRYVLDMILNWATIIGVLYVTRHLNNYALYPLALLIVGSRQHALALLAHDGAHRSAFSKRMVNDVISEVFCAWPIGGVLHQGYREWHYVHHRTLGTDGDPELSYRNDSVYSVMNTGAKRAALFIWDFLGLGIIGFSKFIWAICPRKPKYMLGIVSAWALVALALWKLDLLWYMGMWILSLFTAYWAIFRIRTWSEHVGIVGEGAASSHRFSSSWLMRYLFFPHNTHAHYEHHMWPTVPYYNLPALRAAIKGREISTDFEILRNIKH